MNGLRLKNFKSTTFETFQLESEKRVTHAEDIAWFKLDMVNNNTHFSSSELRTVMFEWKGGQYLNPQFEKISLANSPFDLGDFIKAREHIAFS